MSGFGTSVSRPIYGRGPSPGLRFSLYSLLCAGLIWADHRGAITSRLHYGLLAAVWPVQVALHSPAAAWQSMRTGLELRSALQVDNDRLRERVRLLELAQLRTVALEQENASLRGLHEAIPPLVKQWQVAEVIGSESALLRQRIIINKGTRDGVHASMAVVDGQGLMGQVVHAGPVSAEVILITDAEHALPVQVVRNQLRTIAVGSGTRELLLKFLAVNSDVQPGDLLVSSGLGGVFPAGVPVARISGVRREPNQLLASVRAEPIARLQSSREVLLLELDPAHPAAPASAAALEQAQSPPPGAEPAAPAAPAASEASGKGKGKGKGKAKAKATP